MPFAMYDSVPSGPRLLYDPANVDGAEPTYSRVVELLNAAQKSVHIHMYVWRNDDIGNRIGRAVLAAAERGVHITIIKDLGAMMFEYIEMNRKPFFQIPMSRMKTLTYRLLRPTFPDTYVQDDYDFDLGQHIMQHSSGPVKPDHAGS